MHSAADRPPLVVHLFGRPAALWQGQPLVGLRKKGLALLCYLAQLGRPAPRAALATLLWGEGRLGNLRQELRALRQAPGADRWLQVDEGWVAVHAETDVAQAQASGRWPPGEPLDGLALPDAPDWEAWREALLLELDAARAGPRGAAPSADALVELLADLHGLAAGPLAPLAPRVQAAAVGAPAWQLAAADATLRARGWLRADGAWSGPPRSPAPSAARLLGRALWEVEGPSPAAEALLRRAGATAELGALWLARARSGTPGAAARALEHCADDDQPEALRLAAEGALRAGDRAGAAAHTAALRQRGVDALDPAQQLEACLLEARAATAAGRWRALDEAVAEAEALVRAHALPDGAARVALWVGHGAVARGEAAVGVAALEKARQAVDPLTRAAALAALGAQHGQRGALAEAEAAHEAALAAVRQLGDRAAAARMLVNMGATAERLGRARAARACFADALRLAAAADDRRAREAAGLNLAELERRLGRLGAARAALGAATAGGLGGLAPRQAALAQQIRGDLELCCGRPEEAASWYGRAATAWEAAEDPVAQAGARWLASVAAGCEAGTLPVAAWDAAAQALPLAVGARADLRGLGFEELVRLAPDPQRAAAALDARGDGLGPASAALRAVPAALAGHPPGPGWAPEGLDGPSTVVNDDIEATFDELLVLALVARRSLGWRPALTALVSRAAQGLLPAQAAALRARLWLPEGGPRG
jgi:tetratricopeptide (TPR) repeat protein